MHNDQRFSSGIKICLCLHQFPLSFYFNFIIVVRFKYHPRVRIWRVILTLINCIVVHCIPLRAHFAKFCLYSTWIANLRSSITAQRDTISLFALSKLFVCFFFQIKSTTNLCFLTVLGTETGVPALKEYL